MNRRSVLQVVILSCAAIIFGWAWPTLRLRAEALRKGQWLVSIFRGDDWELARFSDLKEGDIFQDIDPKTMKVVTGFHDGQVVQCWVAESDLYKNPDSGKQCVQADRYEGQMECGKPTLRRGRPKLVG